MNKAQLRQRTRQLAGAELDGLRTDEELDPIIEEAYRQVGHLVTWKWRETSEVLQTTPDQAEYALPSGIDEPQGFIVLNAAGHAMPLPLSEVTLRDLLTSIRRDSSDLPRYYALTGANRVRFGPTPDIEYDVEVMGLAPLAGLDGDSDAPEWDARFHPAIAYLAAAVFLDEEGQDELALHRRGRAEELLTDMVEFYQQSKDTTPIVRGGGRGVAPLEGVGRVYPWR